MDKLGYQQQTKLYNHKFGTAFSIYRNIFRSRLNQSHNHKSHNNNTKRHKHNKYLLKLISICLLGSTTPAFASDIGGVSATANPVANSSGSVTNQAIQVLQGPYITNTYGGGIQCQGPTMNITPYANGTVSYKKPFEEIFLDPVYNNADNDDDSIPDNPGQILYEIPTRTNQKDNYTLSLGVSATWSRPIDKELQAQCKQAAATQISLQQQITANKRLDFEIARLKNCGELMKQGIMFHPKSPYHKVCADVVLVNPPNVVGKHTHKIESKGTSKNLKPMSIGKF